MTKLSRRDFLKITGCAAGTGSLWLLAQSHSVQASAAVRPPGALLEADFLSECIKCGRCAVACISGAIQPGVDGTPYLNGLSGWCDFCMCCTDVCPTNALQPFEPETVKMGTAVIDINRCIAWDYIGCRLCHEKCIDLQDAIWIDEKFRPHVDEEKCNGCNACVNVCPQSAVRGRNKKYGKAVVVKP